MTITVTAAFDSVDDNKRRFRVGPSGCFGYFNSLGYLNLSDGTRADEWTQHFEVLEFWPHMSVSGMDQKIEEAVDAMNGFGPYKDLFVQSSANSIQTNCRENPVDKIFTGYMTIRDFMYYGNGFQFLANRTENRGDALRIAIMLGLVGVSKDMFGNITVGERSSTSEGTATFIDLGMDALALYLMLYGTKEMCAQCWAQGIIGTENHMAGYVRNGRGELRAIRSARGYSESNYSSMSHWLRAWLSVDTFLPEDINGKKGRLTIRQFIDRLRSRMNGVRGEAEQATIIFSMFEELKEMYE